MEEEESLEALLPQAKPMILLSGYEPQREENAVDAWVDVTSASPFYEAEAGGVPGCVALEYMAQSMALCVGLARRSQGLGPKIGFVLGSRRLSVSVEAFKSGLRYRIRVVNTYQDESFGSFDCTISDPDGAVVATAQMTAFQPGDGMTPEIMGGFA